MSETVEINDFWEDVGREAQQEFAPRESRAVRVPDLLKWSRFRSIREFRIRREWGRFAKMLRRGGLAELERSENYMARKKEEELSKMKDIYQNVEDGDQGPILVEAFGKAFAKIESHYEEVQAIPFRERSKMQRNIEFRYRHLRRWRKAFGTFVELKFLLSVIDNIKWRHTVYGDTDIASIMLDPEKPDSASFGISPTHDRFGYWMENLKAVLQQVEKGEVEGKSGEVFEALRCKAGHKGSADSLRAQMRDQIGEKHWPGGRGKKFDLVKWQNLVSDYEASNELE